MELSTGSDWELDISRYKTPLQKLARRLKRSVELWKGKYSDAKATIKRFQNAVADAQRSRDCWREKAEQWKATAEQLQVEWDRHRAEAAARDGAAGLETKRTTAAS